MKLEGIVRRVGGARESRLTERADAPPVERESMEEELAEVQ